MNGILDFALSHKGHTNLPIPNRYGFMLDLDLPAFQIAWTEIGCCHINHKKRFNIGQIYKMYLPCFPKGKYEVYNKEVGYDETL
jgi:hypothetical protein